MLLRMARSPRLDVTGAFYHVLARGNRRATIFHDDADYRAYLARLERYRQRDGLTLYAYVLMPNHLYLLLETGDRPRSRIMQTLQFTAAFPTCSPICSIVSATRNSKPSF